MTLVAGLGNPGPRYRGTYHNIGFDVVDELAQRFGASFNASPSEALMARARRPGGDVLLVKPLTFMNLSGRAIGELQRYFRVDPEALLVIVDDVNLPAGRLRVRAKGSAGGHNGLKSIIEHVGTDAFARLRVGVGRGDPRRDLSSHVLARVPEEERARLRQATLLAADAAECFLDQGVLEAMNRFNAGPKEEDGSGQTV